MRTPVVPSPLASSFAALLLSIAGVAFPLAGQDRPEADRAGGWQQPSKLISSLVTAPPPPSASLSPQGSMLVLLTREALPDLAVIARPHLKLAGLRIDGATWSRQLGTETIAIEIRPIDGNAAHRVPIEPGHWSGPIWSSDERAFALVRTVEGGGELWIADPYTAALRKVPGLRLNQVLGQAVQWLPDQRTLLVRCKVDGEPPQRDRVPAGPIVQEAQPGKRAQVRTYQDLLRDEHDADVLEFYGTSRLATVDAATLKVRPFGVPAMYGRTSPSPDGELLLVTTYERPFSFVVPLYRFPQRTAVIDFEGKVRREVARDRLNDAVPIGGVKKGPRSIAWVPTTQHALYWVEAQDDGDPKNEVPHRDFVFLLAEPDGTPRLWYKTRFRAAGAQFGGDGRLVLTGEFDRKTRRERIVRRDLGDLAASGELLYERSTQDAYSDPGEPVRERTLDGRSVLRMQDGALFLSGQGASPAGNRPFLDRWNLETGEKQRLFQSREGRYETFIGFAGGDQRRCLIASESRSEPRRLLLLDLESGERRVLHADVDPAAQFTKRVQKRLLRYQREDGVPMSGTLYLPPSYREGDRLPCLLWAYPREYVSAADAGQVRQAPDRHLRLRGSSHLFLLLEGYAVFDNASMPIVGPRRSANDTFVDQVRMNARAAIDALAAQGCIDTDKVAVAGHSYGAFMTANLLAHSDLFCCGIARSGAYNRTLTPFGFQNEERTFWEAPEVYFAMSPFMHAHKINEPLLLIHGQDDNNAGTFPIQSKRMFAALKGHGATARLCFLPFESHGYRGRQSVLHCLSEMIGWLDRHCKGR